MGAAFDLVSAGAFPVAAVAPAAGALAAALISEDAFLRAAAVFFPADFSAEGASGGAVAALLEDFGEAARFLAAAFGALVAGRLAPLLPAAAPCLVLADFLAEGFFATASSAEALDALSPGPVPDTPESALAFGLLAPLAPPFPDSLAIGGLVGACG